MASFQAKIPGKRMRKRENKNYSFVPSPYLTRNLKFQKRLQKNSKNKKIPLWLHLKPE